MHEHLTAGRTRDLNTPVDGWPWLASLPLRSNTAPRTAKTAQYTRSSSPERPFLNLAAAHIRVYSWRLAHYLLRIRCHSTISSNTTRKKKEMMGSQGKMGIIIAHTTGHDDHRTPLHLPTLQCTAYPIPKHQPTPCAGATGLLIGFPIRKMVSSHQLCCVALINGATDRLKITACKLSSDSERYPLPLQLREDGSIVLHTVQPH